MTPDTPDKMCFVCDSEAAGHRLRPCHVERWPQICGKNSVLPGWQPSLAGKKQAALIPFNRFLRYIQNRLTVCGRS